MSAEARSDLARDDVELLEVVPQAAVAERAQLAERCERYRALGTTVLNLRLRHRSAQHYLEQLEVVAHEVAPRFS